MGPHNLPAPTRDFNATRDPATDLRVANDLTDIVMEDAAITHHKTPAFQRDDVAKRCDAVL